ncbi:MAG: hypothetical protein ABR985_19425 [Methanotrichaceae archaeon]
MFGSPPWRYCDLPDLKYKGIDFNPDTLSLKDKDSDLKDNGLNPKALDEAVRDANNNRQTIAVWSPEISAIMWYIKKTTPEFSISD